MDESVRVADTLVKAIQKLQGQERITPGRHTGALMKLPEIFKEKTINLDPTIATKPQTTVQVSTPLSRPLLASTKRSSRALPAQLKTPQDRLLAKSPVVSSQVAQPK